MPTPQRLSTMAWRPAPGCGHEVQSHRLSGIFCVTIAVHGESYASATAFPGSFLSLFLHADTQRFSIPMLSQIFSELIDDIRGDTITLKALMERTGREGMLLVCAVSTLPFLIPVSIPGVSTVFGAAIVLLAVALFLNRLPWLPERIQNKPLDAKKLVPALRKGVSVVGKFDRWVKPRWAGWTTPSWVRVHSAAVVFGGVLLMAPLGLIPFSNTAPAVGILFLTVGMLQRDGLCVLFGYLGLVVTVIYFSVLGYLAWAGGAYIFG
jgi:hypothetical protein